MNSAVKKREVALVILQRLEKKFPDAHCELIHDGPFQLLIATILSAQCTDVQVNKVTPVLFASYPEATALALAPLADIERIVRSTGFYKNKAKNIQGCARALVENFEAQVPDRMEDLVALPGVGRKTANVVLGNAFGKAEGVVVDTHVQRITRLLGLTKKDDPVGIERDLMKVFPQDSWTQLSHLLIFLGRRVCVARKPRCAECPLADLCPSSSLS